MLLNCSETDPLAGSPPRGQSGFDSSYSIVYQWNSGLAKQEGTVKDGRRHASAPRIQRPTEFKGQ
jgi:hypothetical protein